MNAEGYNNSKIDGAKNWVIERSSSHLLAETMRWGTQNLERWGGGNK